MHGQISLESALDLGTKAIFSIPFNKSIFPNTTPLVDIGSLPAHLQPEMSASGCASDDRSMNSAPQSPQEALAANQVPRIQEPTSQDVRSPSQALDFEDMQPIDRKNTHVLVVEDK